MFGAEEGRFGVGLGGRGAMPAGLLSGGAVVAISIVLSTGPATMDQQQMKKLFLFSVRVIIS